MSKVICMQVNLIILCNDVDLVLNLFSLIMEGIEGGVICFCYFMMNK